MSRANVKSRCIRLKGLAEDRYYKVETTSVEFVEEDSIEAKVYSGDTLMKAGLLISELRGDFRARLISLTMV